MDKRSFFLAALNSGAALYKRWVLTAFTVIHPESLELLSTKDKYAHQFLYNKDDKDNVYYRNPDNLDEMVKLEGATWEEALYRFRDPIELAAGELKNVKEKTTTTYGNALYNALVIIYAFGDKMPYKTGRIKGSKLEEEIASKLLDTPAEGEERLKDKFYVDELLRYCDATSALAGLTGISCPAATPKILTVDPAILKRRDELLKEHKDQLGDMAVVAKIEKELVDMDKASIADDDGKDFYIKDKTYAISRKRCFIMYGTESGFNSDKYPKLIVPSLREGWQAENIPGMAESARAGSYNRGHETALGGESVKYFYRIFQNTRVAEEDCNTPKGLDWAVTEDNYRKFIGLYPTGKNSVAYTEETAKAQIGKEITTRSPLYCLTKAPSFCAKCVGQQFAANPTGLHIAVSDVGSRFLYVFMQAMHGKALRTAEYRIDHVFS